MRLSLRCLSARGQRHSVLTGQTRCQPGRGCLRRQTHHRTRLRCVWCWVLPRPCFHSAPPAHLARIALTPHEIEHMTRELGQIMSAVERVNEVATPDVPPTSHPIALHNVFRADVVGNTLTTAEALAGAPEADGTRFVVSAILGEEQ